MSAELFGCTFSPSCLVTICQQMNWQKTLDKNTNPNLLQTSCFYYISWNTYSLQFSLKRCLAPCTMLKHVKLKHAQILQYKGVRLKQCVIADTERLNTMSMFTCVLTAGSRYTNICLITILSPFFNDAGLYMCSVFERECKQISVNFNSVTVCYSMFAYVCLRPEICLWQRF